MLVQPEVKGSRLTEAKPRTAQERTYGFSFTDANPGGFGALVHAMMLALNYARRAGIQFVLVEEGKTIPRLNGTVDDLAATGNRKQRYWEDYFTSFSYAKRAECAAIWPAPIPGHRFSSDPPSGATDEHGRRRWYATLVNEIMQLQPEIEAQVETIIGASVFNANTDYTLHIRRTDKIVPHKGSGVESSEVPLSVYVDETMQVIRRYATTTTTETRVYLCTDDPLICSQVQQLFAVHNIPVVWDKEDEAKPTHVQRLAGALTKSKAWEETLHSLKLMYIMARSRHIVGGRMSYFFRIAELLHYHRHNIIGNSDIIRTTNIKDNDVFGRAPYAPPDEPLVRPDAAVTELAKRNNYGPFRNSNTTTATLNTTNTTIAKIESHSTTPIVSKSRTNLTLFHNFVDLQDIQARSTSEKWSSTLRRDGIVHVPAFIRQSSEWAVEKKLESYNWWQYTVASSEKRVSNFWQKLEDMSETCRLEYTTARKLAYEAYISGQCSHHFYRTNLGVHRETCKCLECVMQMTFVHDGMLHEALGVIVGSPVEIMHECFATRFKENDFQTTMSGCPRRHLNDDDSGGHEYMFILPLTRNWLAERGGLVHIYSGNQRTAIKHSFVPSFNTLTVIPRSSPQNYHYWISRVYSTVTTSSESVDNGLVLYVGSFSTKVAITKTRDANKIALPRALRKPYVDNSVAESDNSSGIMLYWINMDKSVERAEWMRSQFFNKVICRDAVRVSASTPASIEAGEHRVLLDAVNHAASPVEVACSCSHLEAIHRALMDDCQLAMICEDDIEFLEPRIDYRALAEKLDAYNPQWDVLQVQTVNGTLVQSTLLPLFLRGQLFTPWQAHHWATGCYLISRRGMEKIVCTYWNDEHEAWDMRNYSFLTIDNMHLKPVADAMLYTHPRVVFNTYTLTVPLAVSREALGSEIHPDHVDLYHAPANNVVRTFYSQNRHRVQHLVPVYIEEHYDILVWQHCLRNFTVPLIVPRAGLCNRLRVVLSYRAAISAYFGDKRRMQVLWTPDQECPAHFLELFCNLEGVDFVEEANVVDLLTSPFVIRSYMAFNQYDIPWHHLYHKLLQPIESIMERLSQIKRENNWIKDNKDEECSYVAVHVRRTDHVHLAQRLNAYTDDSVFDAFIAQAIAKGCKVYVASDNRHTWQQLQRRHGVEHLVNAANFSQDHTSLRKTSVVDAVVDLYMCAGAQEFQGSGGSSFSETIDCLRLAIDEHATRHTTKTFTDVPQVHLRWINVDTHVDRQEHMREQLAKIASSTYNQERFSAVTPAKLTEAKNVHIAKEGEVSVLEICCTTSHLECIRQCYESNIQYAVICEDDICFVDSITLDVQRLCVLANEHDADWDIVQLHTSNATVVQKTLEPTLREGRIFVPWHIHHWAATIYMISRRGMYKLLRTYLVGFKDNLICGQAQWSCVNYKNITKYRPVADSIVYLLPGENMRAYTCCLPFVITEEQLGSDLHAQHVIKFHRPSN